MKRGLLETASVHYGQNDKIAQSVNIITRTDRTAAVGVSVSDEFGALVYSLIFLVSPIADVDP